MAVGLALVLFYVLGPGLTVLAELVAIAAGGAVAGRLAPRRGGFHGGLVAVLWIAAEALSDPLFAAPPDVVGDAAITVLMDIVRLTVGVAAGWTAARLR